MTALDARSAYRLWAPSYSTENAVSAVEERLVRAMTPSLADARLLDAGCGTGRRLLAADAKSAIGIDLSEDMLAFARRTCPPAMRFVAGDVRAMPLANAGSDVTWCRLVIGHLPECAPAYRELARVTAPGGRVIVTDFHPEAYAAGHRRTFRAGGVVHEVEHYLHRLEDHFAAATDAGLHPEEVVHGSISADEWRFYEAAGRAALFDEHLGLKLVLALGFRRRD